MSRFSRLSDGENSARPRVRVPLTTTRDLATRIAAGEVTRFYVHAPRDLDAECRFHKGEVYGVQYMAVGRHLGWQRKRASQPRQKGETVGRVRILTVERRKLGDETNAQAKAAGYHDAEQMLARWANEKALKHPKRKAVFVVTLEPETWAQAQMLAADSSHGFTTNPARALTSDKSEAVDPKLLRPHWQEDADARHKSAEKVNDYMRRRRQLQDQLRRATQEAGEKGIDISPELESLGAQIKALRLKLEAA